MSNYGYCPQCGRLIFSRERRPNGNDMCDGGHTFPSRDALPQPLECHEPPPSAALAEAAREALAVMRDIQHVQNVEGEHTCPVCEADYPSHTNKCRLYDAMAALAAHDAAGGE